MEAAAMTENNDHILKLNQSLNSSQEPGTYKSKSFYTPPDIIEREYQNEILANLLLTWTGCYTKAYGHIVNSRLLQDYVIIYCVDGMGWLKLEGRQWDIKKGDIFVCPPNITHSYGADNIAPWTKYWLHFRGKNASSYMEILGLTLDSPILHIGEDAKLLSWLQDIFNILRTGYTQSNLLFATSYLSNILNYINILSINEGLNKSQDMNTEKVITYMLDNINNNLSLEELSHYTSLSKYHFVRLFKEKMGYTPVDYYIRLKMQKACELLEVSTVKINSISSTLGFNNPYYFSSTFKRIVGQSPQHYREMLRCNSI
jgi:AraC family transcriptional regulator, arabinose operon regulatory protein